MNYVSQDNYDIMESQPTYEHYIEINDTLYNYEVENIKNIKQTINIQMIQTLIHGFLPYSYIKFYNFVYNKY